MDRITDQIIAILLQEAYVAFRRGGRRQDGQSVNMCYTYSQYGRASCDDAPAHV